MWSSKLTRRQVQFGSVGLTMLLAACTVEPLNSTSSSRLAATGADPSVGAIMKSISVEPVETRTAQQVRNHLLFEMNGGRLEPGGQYTVALTVTVGSRSLSIEQDSLTPTSSQISVQVTYQLIDKSNGQPVAQGTKRAVASYDQTPQKFANERASRDAQNRAAKVAARQVHLAIGQALANI